MKMWRNLSLREEMNFFMAFVPFSIAINGMAKQLNDLREKYDEELSIRGIDITNFKV